MFKKFLAAMGTSILLGAGAVAVTAAPAQAAPLIQFKNSVNSYSSIYVDNDYTCSNGDPWILSVDETNWVDDCSGGIRIERSYISPHSFRYHYDGVWHPWHCDETSDINPPAESPLVIQVESDHRC